MGAHLSADAVTEALERLQGLGLIVTDADGLLRLDHAAAAKISRTAARAEQQLYAPPVDRPVFR
jgi:hypothetical protein